MPVSAFTDKIGGFDVLDGSMRNNIAFQEKRETSTVVPK